MTEDNPRGISFTGGFFMLIAFAIACIIAAGLVSEQLTVAMTGKSFTALREGELRPVDHNAMKLVQVITALVGFFLPAVIAASMLSRKPFRLLGFSDELQMNQTGLTIIIMLVGMIISIFALSYLNREIPLPVEWKAKADNWEAEYNRQARAILQLNTTGDYILALIIMGFLPALCEETLFRGGLQNFLTRGTGKPWLSILIVSLIFSAVHASFYGFIPRFFLGAVLGLIYHYSGKLWLSILAHFINNAFAVSVLYLYVRQGKPMAETMDHDSVSWWGILFLPVLVALFGIFRKVSNYRQSNA